MKKYTPELYGDKERWKAALDIIREKSKERGDNKDILFLEKLLQNEPFPFYTLEEKLEQDKELRRYRAKLTQKERLYKKLLSSYESLDELYSASLVFDKIKIPKPVAVGKTTNTKSLGTLVTQWSDWHVGELVKKSHTYGKNEYNPEICKRRVRELYKNTITLIRKEKSFCEIDTLVIHLGGDFMNGWIHLENRDNNRMTPIEEI